MEIGHTNEIAEKLLPFQGRRVSAHGFQFPQVNDRIDIECQAGTTINCMA
jgi:hypothetical protein